jgi:UDP-N-acetylmuramoyl-tripeptide--D-alanyl-D-alanine ligase
VNLTLSEILTATGGHLAAPGAWEGLDPAFTTAGKDSRNVTPGEVYACIPGERFDGHDFAAAALAAGAGLVLAERLPEGTDPGRVVLVEGAVAALGRMAACWREKCAALSGTHTGTRLAAVTGSAGKTTVKEMLYAALAAEKKAARTPGNLNNQIGLPLSMLGFAGDEDVWVLELGISRPGDMEELGLVARPDLALVTNVTTAHAEGLGGVAGVARAKSAIFSFLAPGGQGLACRDYPELWDAARAVLPGVRPFSTRDQGCDFFCRHLGLNADGGGLYELKLPGFVAEISLPLAGTHLAENVAASAGAAWLLGVSGEGIARGLSGAMLPARRFAPRRVGDATLIDDTYNANPLSMARAMQSARDLAGSGPLVLVLGDMRELGEASRAAHAEVGRQAARLAPLAVFHHGDFAPDVESGLRAAGFRGRFAAVADPAAFAEAFAELETPGATMLFKGSRGLAMERFLDALTAVLERKA